MGQESYTDEAKAWLGSSGHYLENPPPGCLFMVAVRQGVRGLFGDEVSGGERIGMCLIGRPVARALPQDGSWGEVTRFVLRDGLPHGTASEVLRVAITTARIRRLPRTIIAYHDRTRHTGCIYKKAGFRKDGTTQPSGKGWGTRDGRTSAEYENTPKRRWRIDL